MFCTKCGAELPAGGRFCSACGAPVAPPTGAEQEVLASAGRATVTLQAAKLASLPTAWKAALIGGALIVAGAGGLGVWVGFGGGLHWFPRDETNKVSTPTTSEPASVSQADKDTQDLISALEDLKQAMIKKLDSDVDNTALTFTGVKDYWRWKRWADIIRAPLRVLEDTLSLLAKPTDLREAAAAADAALLASESGYQALSVVMMYQDLQEVGGKLYYGLYGPPYVAAIEKMLEAADAVNPPFEFDRNAYKEVIKNHLYGGLEDLPGPLVIPRRSRAKERSDAEFGKGAFEVRRSVGRTFDDLIAYIEDGGLPEGFPTGDVVEQLGLLKRQIIESRMRGVDVKYWYLLDGGDQCEGYGVDMSLGAIGDLQQAFTYVAGAVAEKLTVEQWVEVKKVGESLLVAVKYSVPGERESVSCFLKASTIADLSISSFQKTFYADAEEQFYMLPQEMVLVLPVELSNLWMIADDVDHHLRCLLSGARWEQPTSTATPTPTPTPTPRVPSISPATPSGIYVNPDDRSEYLELKDDGTFSYTAKALLGGFLTGEWEMEGEDVALTYHYFGFPGAAEGEMEGNAITVVDEDGEVWAEGWIREETSRIAGHVALAVGARYEVEVIEHYLVDRGRDPRLYLEYRNISDKPIEVTIGIRWTDQNGLLLKDGGQENTRGPISPGGTERLTYRPRSDLSPSEIMSYYLEIRSYEWGQPRLPHPVAGPEIEPEEAHSR